MTNGNEFPADQETTETPSDDAAAGAPPLPPPAPPTAPTAVTAELPAPPPAPEPAHRGGGKVRAGLVGGLVGALVAGGVAYGTVKLTDDNDSVKASSAPVVASAASVTKDGFDIHGVLDKVGNSVVAVEIGQNTGDGGVTNTAAGTGFLISNDGYVLTNNHVVNGADQITVKFADGKTETAQLVGTDPSHDVALVKINDTHGAKALTLGDTKNLRVGDEVLAIGNALDLGDSPTVTLGIVSAKNRSIDTNTEHLDGLIQTDAAINPGNSGGPLMNANGEVVGINTAGVQGANNIGFAIDIDTVKPLVDQLKQGKGNPATTAFLGVASVSVSDLPANTKSQLGITGNTGVLVQQVTQGSAAAQAGVQQGDVILKADGKDIADTNALRDAIQAKKPGDKMTLTVQRNGQSKTIDVTLGSRSSQNS